MAPRPAIVLGLGSNVGDREAALEAALRLLGERGVPLRQSAGSRT
jgi:7,8-dihydro-6-hydroxymethylpterin-pyrophosphokinase